jgi:hypothetical protein
MMPELHIRKRQSYQKTSLLIMSMKEQQKGVMQRIADKNLSLSKQSTAAMVLEIFAAKKKF